MDSFFSYILTAFALVFVIEGLMYGLFTDSMRRMMETALSMPKKTLRNLGLFMASIGIFLVWLVEKI